MQRHEYDTLVNKNTLKCWGIIIIVLVISYIGEIIKGVRTIDYVIVFSIVAIIPWLLTYITYKYNSASEIIKFQFAVGYSLFYTYVIITTQTPISFVYIVPMISIFMAYSHRKLICYIFSYCTIVNLIYIAYHILNKTYISFSGFKMSMTFWEIQIACLILSGIFLYMSAGLIQKQYDVINDVIDSAYKDPLTGLDNVRFIDDNLNSLFNYDKNYCLCVAFIDIDDFKQFNTKYGHSFGDSVLQALSEILFRHANTIKHTYAIRNGGDEFLIVSRTLQDEDFIKLLEDIRLEVENINLSSSDDDNIHVAISVGVATKYSEGNTCRSFKDLYNKADFRNQYAKDVGKNTVITKD